MSGGFSGCLRGGGGSQGVWEIFRCLGGSQDGFSGGFGGFAGGLGGREEEGEREEWVVKVRRERSSTFSHRLRRILREF